MWGTANTIEDNLDDFDDLVDLQMNARVSRTEKWYQRIHYSEQLSTIDFIQLSFKPAVSIADKFMLQTVKIMSSNCKKIHRS